MGKLECEKNTQGAKFTVWEDFRMAGAKNNANPRILARWPRLLGIDEAAEYLSIAPKTIRNGIGPKAPCPFPVRHKKYGRRILFDRNDLDAYADSLGHE